MSRRGFTLVELMIVVAIVGVLAVVAGTAYRKYMDAGRTAEVYAVMGEFRGKEEAYRAESSTYVSTTAIGETDFYPALLATGLEPKAKFWNIVGTTPPGWTTLGINPGKTQLFCGYVAVSGQAGSWGALAGSLGQQLWNSGAANGPPPTTPWWYVNASCDNDGNAAVNATFITSSSTTTVHAENEHK
jgi:prepilin-type N-terminal cleavage/methylation domain-containing protein